MKFGLLKSTVEKILSESYKNNKFSDEIKVFKLLVLENKNISKLFFLYDELSSNKGLNESIVNEYINQSIIMYENLVNKLSDKDFKKLKVWTEGVSTENVYEHIDNLFSNDILKIENKISSKKIIQESLKKKPKLVKESINLPLNTMVNVANKAMVKYLDSLNESEKNEIVNFLKMDDSELKNNFESLKENVTNKLLVVKENSNDFETKSRISEALEKVTKEKYSKINYVKLKNLYENI